jgi:hypothetical protein
MVIPGLQEEVSSLGDDPQDTRKFDRIEARTLRLPLFFRGGFRAVAWQSSDANKKRAARTRLLILTREAGEDKERV